MDDTTVTMVWSLLILVLYGKLTDCRWSLNVSCTSYNSSQSTSWQESKFVFASYSKITLYFHVSGKQIRKTYQSIFRNPIIERNKLQNNFLLPQIIVLHRSFLL